jgi:DNA invertase Pin-like site-specific DNA recombinase
VSTADQTLALQEDALTAAGCGKIFRDVMSGTTTERPGLSEALAYAGSATCWWCGSSTGWAGP